MPDERRAFYEDAKLVQARPGVVRRALTCSRDLMYVENTFEEGVMGSSHHHPHTQTTYAVSGGFGLNIDGGREIARAGGITLKLDGVEHECVCRRADTLLDIFNPVREDSV